MSTSGNGSGSGQSGRMIEWPVDGGSAPGYLALPERTPAPAVIVIQEYWGLEPHIEDIARRFAGAGFVALAPDLYHGQRASEPDEARKLAMALNHQQALGEIHAAARALLGRDDVLGDKVGVIGFCMGGLLSLLTACSGNEIGACVVFYGRVPQPIDVVKNLNCPFLGIYGGADQGIPVSEVDRLRDALRQDGKQDVEIVVYPGAPHAFFNDTRPSYRPEAAADAWQRTLAFFRANLPQPATAAAGG